MNPRLAPLAALLVLTPWAAAQTTPDVGSGPVSQVVKQDFVRAYFRSQFHILTSLPPVADVRRFGSNGYVQEFPDAAKTGGVRYALVRNTTADIVANSAETMFQIYPDVYSYYSSVGVNTAGYPTTDTQPCPVRSDGKTCTYQSFDKNYALFAYNAALVNGTTFTIKDPFFTRWKTFGVGGLGAPVSAEETVNSTVVSGSTATVQRYSGGALYNFTAGNQTGRLILVRDPIYTFVQDNGGDLGFLGLATSEEIVQPNGRKRQTFEGGAVEYEAGQAPVLRLPVASVSVNTSTPSDRLNLGDTVTLTATAYAANGAQLDGRAVTWITSNSRVITVDPAGTIVTVRAVGGGAATVTAVSEGKSSRALTFFVTAPCCQIGEGAPTAAVQQAFQDAVTRNRLSVRLPSPSPVRRLGDGFVQELAPADANSTARYLLAKPDNLPGALLVTGPILDRYLALGGPTGALGYPVADATAGGRQLFAGGALAGNPVQLVTAPILTRWAAQGYEAGSARLPSGPAEVVLSFTATLGVAQPFTGGLYVAHQSGSLNGRTFLISGLALARYASLGGASGTLGLPTGDEFATGGRRRQDFEGGLIDYAPGDAEARVEERERRPQITATPGTVAAGGRIRVAAGGFPSGATLRITVGSQPDFVVQTVTGAYAWEFYVPASTPSGLVNLRAADVNGRALAVGSFVVQSGSQVLAKIAKLRGDLQSGLPGARLPQPIVIAVTDDNGNVLTGIPVKFNASPGASIEQASTVTDDRGQAQAWVRLPLAELPALATAEAGRQVVTFAATARAATLSNFPRLAQNGLSGDPNLGNEPQKIAAKGALLASSASILRYLQNNGELAAPNGPADPALLNTFLRDLCVFDAQGVRVCDGFLGRPDGGGEKNVNPWRLGSFVNGGIDIVPLAGVESDPGPIRDAIAAGAPVLVALSLRAGDAVAGAHFVAAIGVAADGSVLVHDPNPLFRRTTLDEYLREFVVAGRAYRGTLAAALRFVPRQPSALGFLVVTGAAQAEISSPAGPCGFAVAWPDMTAAGDAANASGLLRFRYCDGLQPSYQLDLGGSGEQSVLLTDLGTVAGRFLLRPTLPAAFRLTRPASNWTAAVQSVTFTAGSVLNAATFQPDLSPGALASVFGSGLSVAGRETTVEVGGRPAVVLAATPFQVNFQVPPDLAPGSHSIRITSPYGTTEASIELRANSPGLFAFAGGRGAVVNQDGTVNGVAAAAQRGQVIVVYGTGFGALTRQGNLEVTVAPVRGLLEGSELRTLYAGSAPGFPGLYQINLSLPADMPPGLGLRLVLEQEGTASNPVLIAVQ